MRIFVDHFHTKFVRFSWVPGGILLLLLLLNSANHARAAAPVLDVEVELENLSGEAKRDWPVVLTAYRIFGRNLPADALNPKGYRVLGPDGKELPCMLEQIPPYDVQGNNELVFIVPAMEPGAKLTLRIVNAREASASMTTLDVAGNPNNLIRNGGFEKGSDKDAEGFPGASRDMTVKRSGSAALLLEGTRKESVTYAGKIALHPGTNYYAGVWCKTENVARHGFSAGSGAHFKMAGFDGQGEPASIMSQCYTRDWNKSRFVTRHGAGWDAWGVENHYVKATQDATTLELILDQKKHFTMESAEGKWWLDDFVLFEQPQVTVRFDKVLASALQDGCFLFERSTACPPGAMPDGKRKRDPWYAKPFVHEGFEALAKTRLRGQRAVFCFGLYHEQPLEKVQVEVEGGALAGPNGAKLAVESVEQSPGYHGAHKTPFLFDQTAPVDYPEAKGVRYFAVSVPVAKDAQPGHYTGKTRVLFGGKPYREFPLNVDVVNLELPVLRDLAIGAIHMGLGKFNEDFLKVYAKSGFSSVTIFGGFLKYTKLEGGDVEVDLEDLSVKMDLLARYGIQGGVAPHSDFDLGSRWGGGNLYKKTGGNKERYQREVKRIEDLVAKHPEWPRMIYMTWDEPIAGDPWRPGQGGKEGSHGGPPDPRMEWIAEAAPKALQTADCMFAVFPAMCDHYTMPAFDDTPDFTGPELYRYVKSRGREFGFAGRLWDESARYSTGIMIAGSGARYFHCYYLGNGLMGSVDKKIVRSLHMLACGDGMDDLKVWRLLSDGIQEAKAGKDAAKQAIAKEAEAYLKQIFAVWNADHTHASPPVPYLGWACTWGYDRFYDDWQEQMARYAAKLKDVPWPGD